ncbi:hypothetical protein PISMIDRAFT_678465 [Pisolithus microcarpus 441]|uniref:Uncharacterized protein n=1 Tax=Pisolithus microcarpus 441 TaxID=765257 RepID=A0A0C9YH22_9AGAM|nr:hypothetical protein PISMIDRAFT_678465 [Pisolithus microcarpus 441]
MCVPSGFLEITSVPSRLTTYLLQFQRPGPRAQAKSASSTLGRRDRTGGVAWRRVGRKPNSG